jgi:hypothetical protein
LEKIWRSRQFAPQQICERRPFAIPAFATIAVSPEVLDKYVGLYSSPDAPKKWTLTRDGGTLFVPPGSEGAAALEAMPVCSVH